MTTPANPDDLLAFLQQQFDAREREIQGLLALGEISPRLGRELLAEVDARRRILDIHGSGSDPCDAHGPDLRSIPCDTLLLLALPYADHPDYREDWRPA